MVCKACDAKIVTALRLAIGYLDGGDSVASFQAWWNDVIEDDHMSTGVLLDYLKTTLSGGSEEISTVWKVPPEIMATKQARLLLSSLEVQSSTPRSEKMHSFCKQMRAELDKIDGVSRSEMEGTKASRSAYDKSMLQALFLVIVFHQGGEWNDKKREFWKRLTGDDDATTKSLCTHIRVVIGNDWPAKLSMSLDIPLPELGT